MRETVLIGDFFKIIVYRQTSIFRQPFFGKQCFSSKYVLVTPPEKFWGFALNPNLCDDEFQFIILRQHAPSKSCFSPVSKLPPLCQTPTHRRIYLCKSFHSDMPNFNNFLFNKQTWCISYQCIWISISLFLSGREKQISSNLPFVTISITFLPGKISSEKRCRS
jgi:hypothetical protein